MRTLIELAAAAVALLGVDLLIAGDLAGASLGPKAPTLSALLARIFVPQPDAN